MKKNNAKIQLGINIPIKGGMEQHMIHTLMLSKHIFKNRDYRIHFITGLGRKWSHRGSCSFDFGGGGCRGIFLNDITIKREHYEKLKIEIKT